MKKSAKDASALCPTAALTDDEYGKTIQATVRAHFSDLRICYETAMRAAKARDAAIPSGKIQVYAELTPDGQVFRAWLTDVSLPDAEFQACVLRTYRGMRFDPPPGGSLNFGYPIRFSPD